MSDQKLDPPPGPGDESVLSASEPRGPIAWMANNRIAANLLMVLLLVGGIWTASAMQKEVFPQFQLDVVQVSVLYPGAAPAEVEQGILLPVEEAVRGVQGIKQIKSTASEGSAQVEIELLADSDRMRTFQDIDQAISRIRTFPEETEEPEVRLSARQREVISVALYGDVEIWTLRQLAERLRDRLLSEPTITQVELGNVPEYVTHVEIPQRRLREHELTLGDVARLIEESSRDVPAGAVESSSGEIVLRMKERKQWAHQFADIPIASSDSGTNVTLGDIAEIEDGFEEGGFHSQFDGVPSVSVQVYRLGEQSPLQIAEDVRAVLADMQASLPPGVRTRVDSSAARDFEQRLNLLIENGILAVLIVLGILAVFLELRLAFWVMIGMVVSFVGGLTFLPLAGVSINMISMFGFLVVLGIVVDDTIVVGENVYEHQQRARAAGETGARAGLASAIRGTREVARPVVFSILTNVVAFVPLLFIPGTTGKYWWPLPMVVIILLLVSLFEALFLLPAHLSSGTTAQESKPAWERWLSRRQQGFSRRVSWFINHVFKSVLEAALRFRYVTLASALALLSVVGAFAYSSHMGLIMMPEVAADEIEAGVKLPVGTTPDQAARVARAVTAASQKMFDEHDLQEVAEGIKTNVRGPRFIDVEIVMKPPTERDMSAREVIALWRDEIGDIEGVDQIVFEAERGPGGYRQDISVDLGHSDVDTLEGLVADFRTRLESFESTRDVSDNFDKGKAQFDIRLLPEGRRLGLTAASVGQQVRDAFFGALALRQLRGTNEFEVRVKLPHEARKDVRSFDELIIRTPSGTEVPLREVASVQRGEAFTTITRRNGRRVVTVSTDVEPKSAMGQVLEALSEQELPELRASYPGLTWTFEGTQADMRESTKVLWGGFGIAVLVIYSLLAVVFGSYVQPFLVLGAIPFGVVGAVLGHLLLGYDLSLVSLMGVIALSGVVVNDSLIMIDFANRMRERANAWDAIVGASLRRFRPILLTTLTTFGGLSPIILETSDQAGQLIPMAISLGFGIVFATAIILLLVPCLYLVFDDVARRSSSAASAVQQHG